MSSKLKVLQVIPKLGYGGAETGCYDLAHYLYEQNCTSIIVTSGGDLLKYVNRKKGKEKENKCGHYHRHHHHCRRRRRRFERCKCCSCCSFV